MSIRPSTTPLLLVATSALLCHPVAAQESVTLQFLSFPKSLDPQPVELIVGEGKTIEVEIPTNALSQPYEVDRQASWIVGKTEIDSDGSPVFEVYGQARSLAVSSQIILLIREGENNADGMRVMPINNDIANFGGGKFLFMNAAKVDIAGEVGNVQFALRPGTFSIIQPQPDNENGRNFHAMFYFRKDDEARPFFSSRWPISDQARGLIFFYHDPTTNHLRMHSIRNFL